MSALCQASMARCGVATAQQQRWDKTDVYGKTGGAWCKACTRTLCQSPLRGGPPSGPTLSCQGAPPIRRAALTAAACHAGRCGGAWPGLLLPRRSAASAGPRAAAASGAASAGPRAVPARGAAGCCAVAALHTHRRPRCCCSPRAPGQRSHCTPQLLDGHRLQLLQGLRLHINSCYCLKLSHT
jgi:hypothetical protein